MSPYVTTLLLASLGLGTTITFASSHWLLAWMGLEINTLALLPLMARPHHPRNVEAATKYFLVQAAAAATLLMAALTNAWLTGQWDIYLLSHPATVIMVTLALSMKLGLAPLHTWLPEVLQGLELTTALILSTWQKLAPFILLIEIPAHNQLLLSFLGLASVLMGGWGGLNQTQIRKILAYSSTAHLGWMIMVLNYNPSLAMLNLFIYLVMTTTAFLSLMTNNATTLNSLAISSMKTPALSVIFPIALLSLAGLPPLTGFIPKWLILEELAKQDLPVLTMFMGLSALISLYYYLQLAYVVTLTTSPNITTGTMPWRLLAPTPLRTLPACFMLSTALLPIAPALQALISL